VGVSGSGAGTFAGAAVLLAGVALLASWLPARRASRMDSHGRDQGGVIGRGAIQGLGKPLDLPPRAFASPAAAALA
jgi:hypothetical protein